MKVFLSFVSALLVAGSFAGSFAGSGDVVAAARTKDVVPLAPTFRIVPEVGDPAANSAIRMEAKGAPGASFTLVLTARDLAGVLLLDPFGNPAVYVFPGMVVGANGCWSQSLNVLGISLGMPDYVIEGVVIPVGDVHGHLLSWRTTLRAVTYAPGTAPPVLTTASVEVPGVEGSFTSSTLTIPDALVPDLYHLAENGPGGVYPIG